MSFNAICENKILAEISEFTLCAERKWFHLELSSKVISPSFFLNLHLLLYFVYANRKDFVETVQI